jgi:hypothetical protein
MGNAAAEETLQLLNAKVRESVKMINLVGGLM